ncbi:hypothetical protein DIPPA_27838 [Diplonema papillatum]|nr:hypothetical protein DIPPA_27838 [Diplonema papillatum]
MLNVNSTHHAGPSSSTTDDPTFEDSPSYQIFKPRHDPDGGALMTYHDFQAKYSPANGHALGLAAMQWEKATERHPSLLENRYRLGHQKEMDLDVELHKREPEFYLRANSSAERNALVNCMAWSIGLPCLMPCWATTFGVPSGSVQRLEDGQGGYLLAGEGMHCYANPFMSVTDTPHRYNAGVLTHGDWCLVVVDQGFIGLAMDKGQPVLLPPGFHQWKSKTLVFHKVIDLNEPVIYLGPYTLLTVDEGYAAVTQNNGKQEIRTGGAVHLLAHRNHKFEKFLSMKIQTDKLARIEVITGDNVLMHCDATVNWKIQDVELAAKNAAETMRKSTPTSSSANDNITKLRNDVLQQASASLSSFIGTVNYSDSFSPTAQVQRAPQPVMGVPVVDIAVDSNTQGGVLFDVERMQTAVEHANAVTRQYGIEIISINIISAQPADKNLMTSLARGAVAAAEAQQMETAAKGAATSLHISAASEAQADMVRAKSKAACLRIEAEAAADAETTRAEGAKTAADTLASSQIAVELARIDRTAQALGKSSSLFFGVDPKDMGSLLLNSSVVKK